MKKAWKVIRDIFGGIRFCMAIVGIILMMGEVDDMALQAKYMIAGLSLFVLAVLPNLIREIGGVE